MNNRIKVVAIALAIITVIGYFLINQTGSLEPLTLESNEKTIEIKLGSTPGQIGTLLETEDLITESDIFKKYVGSNDLSNKLKAGTYKLDSSMGIDVIANIIAEGKEATNTITILPGSSESDIRQVFVNQGFTTKNVNDAFSNIKPKDYINGVNADSLEGYIAPDTYSLGVNSTVEDYLILSLQQFSKNLSEDMVAGFEQQGLSINGATILASIVQQESSLSDNQAKIAQVFLKRLDEGISLGSDVTFYYAAEQLGVDPAIDLDSPYNTRRYPGLPPTPIGNFNRSALEAVANPSTTDYLFFVAGDDGITYFSNTLAEHEALAAEHCIELCKL